MFAHSAILTGSPDFLKTEILTWTPAILVFPQLASNPCLSKLSGEKIVLVRCLEINSEEQH